MATKRRLSDVGESVVSTARLPTWDRVYKYSPEELMRYFESNGLKISYFPEDFQQLMTGKLFLEASGNPSMLSTLTEGLQPLVKARLFQILDTLRNEKNLTEVKEKYLAYTGILTETKMLACTPIQLEDPRCFISLPISMSSLRKPYDRFGSTMKNGTFLYQGRHQFQSIYATIRAMKDCEQTPKTVYLNGCMGVGKSHILAAVVCALRKSGERVLYLPDCKEFLSTPFSYLQHAFAAAFADDAEKLLVVDTCTTDQELLGFSGSLPTQGIRMFVVVDQVNVLDQDSPGNHSLRDKARVTTLIAELGFNHYLVKSSSANFELAIQARATQENVTKINLFEGLDDLEMAAWWDHWKEDLPELSLDFKNNLEQISGRNPLLLRGFYIALKEHAHYELVLDAVVEVNDTPDSATAQQSLSVVKENDYWDYIYAAQEWKDTISRIHKFSNDQLQAGATGYEETAENCIFGGTIEATNKLIDYRYFYPSPNGRARSSCGLARNVLAVWLRSKLPKLFDPQLWVDMILKSSGNSSSLGFFVEDAVLSQIGLTGVPGLDSTSSQPTIIFTTIPRIPRSNQKFPLLLLPARYNYEGIDGVWVRLDPETAKSEKQKLLITLIQVTINNEHTNSETKFFSEWSSFITDLVGEDYDYEVAFMWIVENQATFRWPSAEIPENTRLTRRNNKLLNPKYKRIVLEIAKSFPRIGSALSKARTQGLNRPGVQHRLTCA